MITLSACPSVRDLLSGAHLLSPLFNVAIPYPLSAFGQRVPSDIKQCFKVKCEDHSRFTWNIPVRSIFSLLLVQFDSNFIHIVLLVKWFAVILYDVFRSSVKIISDHKKSYLRAYMLSNLLYLAYNSHKESFFG